MRILSIVPALEAGGVERGTLDLALSLKKKGESVIVISNGGRLVSNLEDNGIPHFKLPVHRKSPLTASLVPKIAGIIKREHIDVVHASSRVPAWLGFFASKLSGTPFVTSCHGYYSKHFLSRVMGWGELVMVISESVKKRMVEDFKVPEEKIRLVYRGLDLGEYLYDPDKYEGWKGHFKIINVGRLTPIKGQIEFIKAIKHVLDELGSVEAWIVGGAQKGKERYDSELKSLVKDLGLENHVKFLGFRSDVKELLKEADCLVLSTNVPEGFGRTVIEAGAVGTSVCASEAGGIKEIIDEGVSGLLFPPGDERKMASAIIRMLRNPGLSKTCAQNLRRKVESSFTLEQMAERTLAVYKEAVEKFPAKGGIPLRGEK